MRRARDSQRSRVYKAEGQMPGEWGNTLGSIQDVQKYVDDIIGSRWFRSRWRLSGIVVQSGRGGGVSRGGAISLGVQARNPLVVLHEVAHEVIGRDTPRGRELAFHGREFAAVYLMLVHQFVGKETADLLRQKYRECKVAFTDTRGLVPRKPRYEVKTQQQVRQEKREKADTPPLRSDMHRAARTLRKMISQGEFGASGSTQRTRALAVARTMEQAAVKTREWPHAAYTRSTALS